MNLEGTKGWEALPLKQSSNYLKGSKDAFICRLFESRFTTIG
jgi:hypothetical protein